MGEAFHQHERGKLATKRSQRRCVMRWLTAKLRAVLSRLAGGVRCGRPEVIAITHKLREQGHRAGRFPIPTACIPPSGRKNTRKFVMLLTISIVADWDAQPKYEFTSMFCRRKVFHQRYGFFDDNADNIEGANQLGITSILVKIKPPSRTISRRRYAKTIQDKARHRTRRLWAWLNYSATH